MPKHSAKFSKLIGQLARFVNRALKPLGISVVRHSKRSTHLPPEVLRHPMDVIYMQGNRYFYRHEVALEVPVAELVNPLGFGYGPDDWNPFVQTLREMAPTYEASILSKYYAAFQPANAAEALRADFTESFRLRDVPAYGCRLLIPWTAFTVHDALEGVRSTTFRENLEHGRSRLGVDGGDLYFGPVGTEKGRIEHARMLKVFESVRKNGYIRRWDFDGDIHVYVLRKGNRLRYLMNNGTHRAAAVSALGFTTVPARLIAHHLIEHEHIASWPQVRMGLWDRRNAQVYFEHLFKNRAHVWKRQHGIVT